MRTGAAIKVRALHNRYPEMSKAAIARKAGCTAGNVTYVLKKYLKDTSPEELAQFQENKADIFDAIQHRMLSSISAKKISNASALQSVTAAAILEDKARLVRGQANSINVNVLLDVVEALKARQS